MSLRTELLKLLLRLPKIHTVRERKTLVDTAGFGQINHRITWEGSSGDFCNDLLNQLCSEGQDHLVAFLRHLADENLHLCGFEDRNSFTNYANQTKDLTPEQWEQEFRDGHSNSTQPKSDPAKVSIGRLQPAVEPFCGREEELALKSKLIDLEKLIQEVRSHLYGDIQRLHGPMPLWGIDHWVPLSDLFVDVNVLEDLSSHQRSELDNLWQDFSKNPSYRSLDRIGLGKARKRISGLEILKKDTNLMMVGKPGSGKTTYLQRVVTECNSGNLQTHRIPTLIKLREFVNDGYGIAYSLEQYLERLWNLSAVEVQLVLNQGQALVLLDGLDEVIGENSKTIDQKIKQFARNHPRVQIIVTCRTQSFTGDSNWKALRFDFVEVADFNEVQIRAFVGHWFKTVVKDQTVGVEKAQAFLEELFREGNKSLRELTITPVLLSLTCAVFHQVGKFYNKQAKLYEEGLELLLMQWDESREIQRDNIYRDLSVERKLELLGYLALKKFEQEQYVLFEQSEIEKYIAEFLKIEQQASCTVLKAIEVQHGLLIERANKIWSFSHLTFQEYLVAKQFCDKPDWRELAKHITQDHWRQSFELVLGLAATPEKLIFLMKNEILPSQSKNT
jgi:predicted NACHT family NTPase